MSTPSFIACRECDLVQRDIALPPRGAARCARCGATLYRDHPASLERTVALVASAAVVFAIANVFPMVGLQLQGELVQTTLINTVANLYREDMKSVAALVLATTVVVPAVQLAALAYLLVPLRFGRPAPHSAVVFRLFRLVQPWGMVEVFMLGVLVAVAKLGQLARVVPGIALWSFAALMLLMAAIAATFDPRAFWSRISALR